MTQITIKILEDNAQIVKLMREALLKEINKYFTLNVIKDVIKAIRPKIKLLLTSAPEPNSIIGGDLGGQLGIPSGAEAFFVNRIVTEIANNIALDFHPIKMSGNNITGGFTFYVAKDDFSDILALPEATIITSKGQILPWLEWLLIQGNKVIISEHSLAFSPGHSRSHSYIMVKDAGGFWSVPSQFAGTVKDNWITRALDTHIKAIQVIVATQLKKVL